MVFQGEGSKHNVSPTPRNWFSRRKFKQPKNSVKKVAGCRSFRGKCDSPILKTMIGNNSSGSVEENEVLKKKIKRIEKQNYSQQRRLQQLEKLVMQLSHNWAPHVLPCLSTDRPPPGSGGARYAKEREVRVPSQADCEDQDSDCQTEEGDSLAKDLASLMDEFDRNGRENGMVYGVTPSHSFADSDDLAPAEGTEKLSSAIEDVSKAAPLADDVCSTPLPIFITPTYEDWTKDNKENNLVDAEEPQRSPQPCFTTPVLLTSDALKQAEQSLDDENYTSGFDPEKWTTGLTQQSVTQSGEDDSRKITSGKTCPFSNLLSWINQTPSPNIKHHRASEKECRPVKGHTGSQCMGGPPGFCSPGSHSVGSASDQVRKWSQSLRLPLLSPMSESFCSEQEANVSFVCKLCM